MRHGLLSIGLAIALATTSCAAPVVDVHQADVRDVYRDVTAYALNSDRVSDDTVVALRRADLEQTFADDPLRALRELHEQASGVDRRARLFALSELCYVTAEETDDRDLFFASAAYAYLFLFGEAETPLPGPFRRRFRRACDLYGVAVALAFTDADGEFAPTSRVVAFPVGGVEIVVPELPLRFSGFAYGDLRPAIEMDVQGFRARDIRSGIGAPLVALRRAGSLRKERRSHIAPNSALAVTALVRFEGQLEDISAGTMRARMDFFEPDGVRDVEIAGRTIPVEFDVTAPLAWELAESKEWDNEIAAFLDTDEAGVRNAVLLTEPYQKGRIPILFVHGTASSPSRWAEILNELHDDGYIAGSCQFWIYQYGSGAPILASTAGLCTGLDRVMRDIDPKGEDAALRQLVVIGHSQGGLLTRLLVSESEDRFWNTVADRPIADLELSDSERRYAETLFFFQPSPYPTRVVFLATPHQGSHIAGSWIGALGASLVSVPKNVVRGAGRLAKRALGRGATINLENFSTAVDDMKPGSAFLDALNASPMSSTVRAHSIVAVEDDGPLADGDDGVVLYTSAHLPPESATEVVVRSGHSCQQHPGTVAEIRRILREHLKALGR